MQILGTWEEHKQALRLPSGVLRHDEGKIKGDPSPKSRCKVLASPQTCSGAVGWGSQVHGLGLFHSWGPAFAKSGKQVFLCGSQQVQGQPYVSYCFGCPESRLAGPCYLWDQVGVGLTLIKDG